MAKVFVIPFTATLTALNFLHILKYSEDILVPVMMITAGISLSLYIFKTYTFSILFTSVTIALLVGCLFLEEREDFNSKRSLDLCSEEYVKVKGTILQFPLIGDSQSTILIRTEKITRSGKARKVRVVLSINISGDLRHLSMGDKIEVDTTIREPRPPVNFYPTGSDSYLLTKGIHFTGYSKSALFAEKINGGGFIMGMTRLIREKVRSLIEKRYKREGAGLRKEGQMLEALLLGDRGRISAEFKETLLRAGVYHLFAVSGAHIGIIALIILFLLKKAGIKERWRYISLILFLLIFLVLTGFKISAERAVLMAVLLSVSKIFYLRADPMNILSFSGLILIIIDPCSFLDPGFNLTFLITAGIISGRNIFFTENSGKNSNLIEAVTANLNAAICSIPLSLFFFMRYSFTGFLSGIILLPVTAVIMSLSLPLIPLSLVPFLPLSPLLTLTDFSLKIFLFFTGSFSKWFDLSIFRSPPSIILIVAFYTSFFVMCYSGRNKLFKTIIVLFTISILFMTMIRKPRYAPGFPEIYFLDVGQGDSHIVVLPGGDSLLIDGGGAGFGDFEAGKQIVLPFILRKGIRVRWIAVSHYHPDHCRGINEIVHILKPEEVWISSVPDNSEIFNTLSDKCRGITTLRKVASGFSRGTGKTRIEIKYPFQVVEPFSTKNDHSQVIEVTYGNTKILFTGDIEGSAENAMVKKYGSELKCTVLKVPHHGSVTSSTPEFLKMCRPDYAVFPLGYRNSFGFPHKDVLKRYRAMNNRLFFTSEHGGIVARLKPGNIKFEVSRFSGQRDVKF